MFIISNEIKQVEMLPGVKRRTLGTTDSMMICEFHLDDGAVVPRHQHPHEQVGYVVSGVLELTIGDETQQLHAGDSYAIPPDVEHNAVARGAAVIIDGFTPPREDYR